ncbi:MAG: hypothetical protein AAGA09_03190 [Pseudomonadota bacterium]
MSKKEPSKLDTKTPLSGETGNFMSAPPVTGKPAEPPPRNEDRPVFDFDADS